MFVDDSQLWVSFLVNNRNHQAWTIDCMRLYILNIKTHMPCRKLCCNDSKTDVIAMVLRVNQHKFTLLKVAVED